MKQTRRFLTVFLLVAAFSASESQAQDLNYHLKLKKGDHYKYIVTSSDKADQNLNGQAVKAEQSLSLTFTLKVADLLKNGHYLLESDYKQFKVMMNMGGNITSYNSDSLNQANWMSNAFKVLTDTHLKFEVSPSGAVSNISGLEALNKAMDSEMRLSNLLRGFGTSKFITQLFSYLPDGKVHVGSTWVVHTILPESMSLPIDLNYKLAEVTANKVTFNFNSKFVNDHSKIADQGGSDTQMTETGSQNGNVIADPKTNLFVSSVLKQEIDVLIITTNLKTQATTSNPMKIVTENHLKRIPVK